MISTCIMMRARNLYAREEENLFKAHSGKGPIVVYEGVGSLVVVSVSLARCIFNGRYHIIGCGGFL